MADKSIRKAQTAQAENPYKIYRTQQTEAT